MPVVTVGVGSVADGAAVTVDVIAPGKYCGFACSSAREKEGAGVQNAIDCSGRG